MDYDHVIGGDENSRGKVTGGHSLLHGDVRIVKKVGNPAKNGVYRASIEVKKKDGTWQEKTSNGGVNTMFPENWDEARIIDEINSAWENRKDVKGKDSNMWQGISKSGVLIRGYKSPRITAYPIYENR
ncbi:EndoU domain-containing protein [Leptotrichia sp. HSP-536]|uniref:EndoU domain-containing protein n=1 Tax=Leptotrichia alba TaxID=3239304 RepID=A0AB39V8I1_9FUSO